MNVHPGSVLFKLLSEFEQPWKMVSPETYQAYRVRKRVGFEDKWHVFPSTEKKYAWAVVTFDPTPYEARIAMGLSLTKGEKPPDISAFISRNNMDDLMARGATVRSGIEFELRSLQRLAIDVHAQQVAKAVQHSDLWTLRRLLDKTWLNFLFIDYRLEMYVRRADEAGLQDANCFDSDEDVLRRQFNAELELLSKFFQRSA